QQQRVGLIPVRVRQRSDSDRSWLLPQPAVGSMATAIDGVAVVTHLPQARWNIFHRGVGHAGLTGSGTPLRFSANSAPSSLPGCNPKPEMAFGHAFGPPRPPQTPPALPWHDGCLVPLTPGPKSSSRRG